MTPESCIKLIQQELAEAPAAEVADAFLSPHIDREFFLTCLDEEGPSVWIVNRSDVWTETLLMLSEHRLPGISERAREKVKQRSSKVLQIPPPAVPKNYTEITDDSVEDFLGHPMVPLESILFFARSIIEDHRSSAALSLARRFLEFPPSWFEEKISEPQFRDAMFALSFDPSSYVRSYAARNPLLTSQQIAEALQSEKNALVAARLIQHPATKQSSVEEILLVKNARNDDALLQTIAAMDSRPDSNTRREVINNRAIPALTRRIHEWHLLRQSKA